VTAFFVHDHEHESWVRAEEAYFVHSEDLPTPMLSGLAAFTTEESAQVFAAKVDGRTLTFDALLAYYQEKFPPSVF
jgi:copper chaperone NosL